MVVVVVFGLLVGVDTWSLVSGLLLLQVVGLVGKGSLEERCKDWWWWWTKEVVVGVGERIGVEAIWACLKFEKEKIEKQERSVKYWIGWSVAENCVFQISLSFYWLELELTDGVFLFGSKKK